MDYASWNHDADAFKLAQLEKRQRLNAEASALLVAELGGRFNLSVAELPAVVVAEKMWRGPWLVVPNLREADDAADVLGAVCDAADPAHGEGVALRRLDDQLSNAYEGVRKVGPDKLRSKRLHQLGDVASKVASEGSYKKVVRELLEAWSAREAPEPSGEALDDAAWETHLLDYAAYLAIAHAAEHGIRDFRRRELHALEQYAHLALEADSLSFLRTAMHAARSMDDVPDSDALDHSVVVAPLWKAIELEFNLSVFQFLRRSKGVEMPSYFNRPQPKLGDLGETVGGQKVYFNRALKSGSDGVQWPTLGQAHVLLPEATPGSGTEAEAVGAELTSMGAGDIEELRAAMIELNRFRRNGSHVGRLGPHDAESVMQIVEGHDLFAKFVAVKSQMRPAGHVVPSARRPKGPETPLPAVAARRVDGRVKRGLATAGWSPDVQEKVEALVADLATGGTSRATAASIGRLIGALAKVQTDILEPPTSSSQRER